MNPEAAVGAPPPDASTAGARLRGAFGEAARLLGLALLIGVVLALGAKPMVDPAPPKGRITLATALALPDPLWVDARSEEAYAENHVPGAIHLNRENYDRKIGELLEAWRPGRAVIVYCDRSQCGMSKIVAGWISEREGLPDVYALQEGWDGWLARSREASAP